jgi:hypothetical protein
MSEIYIVDFDKQCSTDCLRCEQSYVAEYKPDELWKMNPGQVSTFKRGEGAKFATYNQSCARCMSCRKVFQTPPLSYTIPIPRDTYTLTHQPEQMRYIPEDYRKVNHKRCQNCDNFYLDDHRKHVCHNCHKTLSNIVNCPKAYNPGLKEFYFKHIPEY